jgi:hypothetical protein
LSALLQLLTGLQRDPDGGLGVVDPQTFRNDPDRFRRIWHSWASQAQRQGSPVSTGALIPITLTIVNNTDSLATLYWRKTPGERIRYVTLSPQDSYRQQTFATHQWVAVFQDDPQEQTIIAPRWDTTWELRPKE